MVIVDLDLSRFCADPSARRTDPRYPLEVFQRVITVSLETMRIVNGLPGLEID